MTTYYIAGKKPDVGWRVASTKEEPIHCSLVKSPIIYIEPVPKTKIELLLDEYPHREWVGYLVGQIAEENFFVDDITIPPHKEALAAAAEVEPFNIPDNCIGIIHSHNTMGAFHSGTDHDYVDQNFPVSITVALKLNATEPEFDVISHAITACGKHISVAGSIKFVQPEPEFDVEEFIKGATENINMGIKTVTSYVRGLIPDYPGCKVHVPVAREFQAKQALSSCPEVTYNVSNKGILKPSGKELAVIRTRDQTDLAEETDDCWKGV